MILKKTGLMGLIYPHPGAIYMYIIGNHMLIFQLSFSLYILYFVVVSIEGLMED